MRLFRINPAQPSYKWYLLILAALTSAFGLAAPVISLSVLFDEISADLNLSLVQVGIIWGFVAMPGLFSSLFSGIIGDNINPTRVMLVGTFLLSLAGAARGLASDFLSMAAAVFAVGFLAPLIMMSAFKLSGIWFPKHQLGIANGIFSMGIGLGFLTGSLFSATVLSPWLGGWRNVMFFYGGLTLLLCIPWSLTSPAQPAHTQAIKEFKPNVSQALNHVVKIKNIWLLALTLMGLMGCYQGITGYLPLYLRGQGWTEINADGALSLFNLLSMIFVLPIAIWSDRKGARKEILLVLILILSLGTGGLAFADGIFVWIAVILVGLVRDGARALLMTMVFETRGIGPVYAGTANGLVMMLMFIGNFLSPPIGNKLADIAPGFPFIFWAILAVVAVVMLTLVRISPLAQERTAYAGAEEVLNL